MAMASSRVAIELRREEAIVLFEWLTRFNKRAEADFDDQAEQRVLWDIEAMLESALVELMDPRYDELLAAARAQVRDPQP
jgi:hypothetical protein